MTGERRLIDTNVLVHAYVLIEPNKNARARALLRQIWKHGFGVTSLQNLCEFVAVESYPSSLRSVLASKIQEKPFS